MSEPTDEPTLAEVLAEIRTMRAEAQEARATADHRADRLEVKLDQVRADIASVKVDTAYTERYIGDLQVAQIRHAEDPGAHRRAA